MLAYDPEQLTALPPIRTVLELGKKRGGPQSRTVILHARLTEIGTLDMWCSEIEGSGVWRLQFDVRAATQTDVAGHAGTGEQGGIVDERVASECRAMIAATFGSDAEKPEGLAKRLAAATELSRNEWPPTLLRCLWEALVEHEAGRRRSPTHEARWLNLLGFSLRPGFGVALDDWRVAQTWRLLQGKLVHPGPMGRTEWWILWRRIAAGLPAGQQRALAEPLLGELRTAQRSVLMKRGANLRYTAHEGAELWRMLGSLELLAPSWKLELGGIILDLAAGEKLPAVRAASLWALGRLAAREPLHGPLNAVVGPEVAEAWIERALKLRDPPETLDFFLLQAARRTRDRYRDVSERVRREVLDRLAGRDAPSHYQELVREGGELANDEQGLVFGESLPAGLVLTSAGHD